tara:strand:- start:352 stop:972 length:621 start_codon:yes stop_codon:yes gene_type:complete
MTTKLNNFLSKIGEGVKPNMFVVDISWPQDLDNRPEGDNRELVNLLCKSTALPASNIGVIEVPFRGRTVKIAGDRTFDTWSATFFNDKDFKIRTYFEKWLEQINTHESNNAPLFVPTNSNAGYMASVKVKQMRKDDRESGSILRQYDLLHAFPTSVSQIDLAYDSNDQIEEFSVEFQYSYWTSPASPESNLNATVASNANTTSITT